nr:hypothetical protein [Ferrovum sp.]
MSRREDAVLIGLSGRAGSGKDTTANLLVGEFLKDGTQVKTLSFAGKLKEVICDVFCVDPVLFENRVLKNTPMLALGGQTPRKVAQFLGTEAFRSIRTEVWVDYAMRQAQKYLSQGISVIITDCRFLNEADAIASYGGYIISLVRDSVEVYDHQSETSIDEIKARYATTTIQNNGSMADLAVEVRKFYDSIL